MPSDETRPQVIYLMRQAPRQPAFGRPCNGCGVCCASEACPVGIVLSGRTRGACSALTWNDHERRYRCALVWQPSAFLPAGWRWTAPVLRRLALRFISAGSGCDSSTSSRPA